MTLFHYFITISIIAFVITTFDKILAVMNKRRISEKALLGIVFFGGTVGSGLAMIVFRHKISKVSYLWKFLGIVFLQILIAFFWNYTA